MPVIIEGLNGTFIGNQDTIFAAHASVKEAIERINNHEVISNSNAKNYLVAFELIKTLHGLNENQQKYYESLKEIS